jgi:hypothetical protein
MAAGSTKPGARLFPSLVPLALVAVAVAQLWPGLSAGLAPPISWDHGAHLGKAILVAEELLPWLRGWTDRVEAGVPQHTLYTPVGTLWILLFRLLTPHLEWHQTYAIAFAGFRTMVGLAAYRLTRAAGGGSLGGLGAGLLALADWGDHSEGGWFYDVLFGVWPMSLAMCVFFFGLADLLGVLDSGRRTQGVRATALLGIALFSHQASLLALGALLPALILVRATERPAELRRDTARTYAIFAGAGALASWWMLPMLAHSEWLDDHGQLYQSAFQIGARLVAGEGILNGGHWAGALAGLGLLAGLFSRGTRRVYALGALLAMLLATPGWLVELDLVRWLPPLGRIMYPRFMMVAKPLLFALAGCLLHDLVVHATPAFRALVRSWRGQFGLAVTMALVAPFLGGAWKKVSELLVVREAIYTSGLGRFAESRAVWAWLREHPPWPFFRVLYVDESSHLPQAAPAYSGHPGLIVGVLVGEAFRNTPDTTDPDALRALNVRYVVATTPLPPALRREVDEVRRFGSQIVYELRGHHSEVVSDRAGHVHPRLRALERERVVVEPNGATELLVRRAFAPGWRAYADGKEVPITPQAIAGSARLRLMAIEVPAGTQRLEVVYRGLLGPTVAGAILSVLGLIALAIVLAWPHLPEPFRMPVRALVRRLGERAAEHVPQGVRTRWHLGAIALPFVVLAGAIAGNARGHHFAYDLARARVAIRHPDGRMEPCDERTPDGKGWQCPQVPYLRIERTMMIVDGRFHGCITAHPPPRGTLHIEWPEALLRRSLVLGAGISDETHAGGFGAPVEVAVFVDEERRNTLSVPNGRQWVERVIETNPGPHRLRIEISATDPSRRWLCIDAIAR